MICCYFFLNCLFCTSIVLLPISLHRCVLLTKFHLQLRKGISCLPQLCLIQHRQCREEALLVVALLQFLCGCSHLCRTCLTDDG